MKLGGYSIQIFEVKIVPSNSCIPGVVSYIYNHRKYSGTYVHGRRTSLQTTQKSQSSFQFFVHSFIFHLLAYFFQWHARRILTNKRNVGEVAQDSECAVFSKFKQQNSFEGIPAGNSNSQNQITISIPTPEINAQESITHPLLHFIDDWPRKDKMIADRTQLSISIPNDSSDYSLSPIRLVHEFNRLEDTKKHSSWIPISWDDPMMGGGPLGEVLTKKKEDR
ncbi:hypothetical protein KSP40_PGU003252 [Platanthera guangdongensis]|uniref:Uncharacterized protein n=1 Tax=Platanthera guangdongensis TaxID=2320717 RepID=A0ABR2M741_9ASPA